MEVEVLNVENWGLKPTLAKCIVFRAVPEGIQVKDHRQRWSLNEHWILPLPLLPLGEENAFDIMREAVI
jgi:hypothetical protein